jgi:hypothetical protein
MHHCPSSHAPVPLTHQFPSHTSAHMEKEGLVRGIKFLAISLLVIDRHMRIEKWLKSNEPDITCKYDVCKAFVADEFISI